MWERLNNRKFALEREKISEKREKIWLKEKIEKKESQEREVTFRESKCHVKILWEMNKSKPNHF